MEGLLSTGPTPSSFNKVLTLIALQLVQFRKLRLHLVQFFSIFFVLVQKTAWISVWVNEFLITKSWEAEVSGWYYPFKWEEGCNNCGKIVWRLGHSCKHGPYSAGISQTQTWLELRQAWLINGILYNSEIWQKLTEKDIRDINKVDMIVGAHYRSPCEQLYIETSSPTLSPSVSSRR